MFHREISIIEEHARRGADLRLSFLKGNATLLVEVARIIASSIKNGGKILICGNGGSAADAQHMAAEFVGRFKRERPPLPAIALTTDTSILTAVSNDYSFKEVFSRQLQALAQEGDVLVAFSTSGKSKNILKALDVARQKAITTVGITGKDGGEMTQKCHHILRVPSDSTPLIQEVHITIAHLLCELVDAFLFESR